MTVREAQMVTDDPSNGGASPISDPDSDLHFMA